MKKAATRAALLLTLILAAASVAACTSATEPAAETGTETAETAGIAETMETADTVSSSEPETDNETLPETETEASTEPETETETQVSLLPSTDWPDFENGFSFRDWDVYVSSENSLPDGWWDRVQEFPIEWYHTYPPYYSQDENALQERTVTLFGETLSLSYTESADLYPILTRAWLDNYAAVAPEAIHATAVEVTFEQNTGRITDVTISLRPDAPPKMIPTNKETARAIADRLVFREPTAREFPFPVSVEHSYDPETDRHDVYYYAGSASDYRIRVAHVALYRHPDTDTLRLHADYGNFDADILLSRLTGLDVSALTAALATMLDAYYEGSAITVAQVHALPRIYSSEGGSVVLEYVVSLTKDGQTLSTFFFVVS